MHAIAALNETRQLQTGRIQLRPEEQPNTMRAAACCIRLAANLNAGGYVPIKNDVPPTVDHLLLYLEWVTRLPILFRETSN
jgi:hypothetical protein